MAIGFNEVPAGIRVPFLYAEFDNANAVQGAGVQPYKTLMIGQKLAAGTKPELEKQLVTSFAQAKTYFGAGSQVANMCKAYFDANSLNELHVIPIDDAGAGVASTGSILLGGAVTKAGTLKLYIAGQKAEVGVAVGDALADIVTSLVAVITALEDMPVSTAPNVTPEQMDITALNKGIDGDNIDLRLNYFFGDETPEGLTTTIVAMNGGATNPDVQEAIDILAEEQFILWVTPYSDAANLLAIETELLDRFGPIRQNDGYHITGARGTHGELVTLGNTRNSQFTIIKRCSGPSMPYEHSSNMVGVIAAAGMIDPARPFQTLSLSGILSENESEALTLAERDILLNNGIATDRVDAGGTVRIERVITTYKKNPAGADDISYLDLNTLLTLSYLRYDFRNFWLSKYPRHKLASDGTQFGAGQAVMTPKVAKAEAVGRFRIWEEIGLVEGIDQFKEDLIVERNLQDPNRLDFLLPPDIMNQLRVVGVKIGFLL